MQFLVLGPIAVRRGAVTLTVGSPTQRSLLALLLVHADHVVSTDRIIDEVWGEDSGHDRHNALWVHLCNLRSALEPSRSKGSRNTVLLTRPPGYVIDVGAGGLDSRRFEELVQHGRALLGTDPGSASAAIGQGLAMWRGSAYADVAYESFAQAEISRLEEIRLEALELRVDADLRRGLAPELVGELQGLVREHPWREQLTAELMVALYRSGRQVDALGAFRRLHSQLEQELGADPSTALCRLEALIVSRHPSLGGRTVVAEVALSG
jgi:DNA-binding SARP family transcriptional activator